MNYFQVYALMNLNVLIALAGIFKPNSETLKLNCNPKTTLYLWVRIEENVLTFTAKVKN